MVHSSADALPGQPASARLGSVPAKYWRWAAYIIIGLGLLLRVVVWWQQRSIFLDEANLIRNYVERTYGQLFQNLDYEQYAPPLFSVAVKACLDLFGNNELSTRLFPLLCSLGTLLLFRRLVQRWLRPPFACLALAFVAFGGIFIDYATECKQYATDGLMTLVLLEAAHWTARRPLTWSLALGLAALGATAVWLSMASVFALAAVGLWLLARGLQQRHTPTILRLIGVGLCWAISFGVYFVLLLKANAESQYLQQYHRQYFLAFPPASVEDLRLLGSQLGLIFDRAIGKTVLALALGAFGFAVGAWRLVRRRDEAFWLVLLPILLCLVASALHYYSLIARLTLFLLPLVVLVVFIGLAELSSKRLVQGLFLALAVVALVGHQRLRNLTQPFHSDYAEVRDGLEYIARHQQRGEVAFIYHNVVPVARYYLQHHDQPVRLQAVVLQPYRANSADIIEQDLLRLREQGHRQVWLLYDRDDPTLSDLAAANGEILRRHDFYKGYALLLDFRRPIPLTGR